MISKISGTLEARKEFSLLIKTGGLSYEILVPKSVMKSIEKSLQPNTPLELITYHYYQQDQSKSVPVLIGFNNEIEKEFFEKFISVSGIGPKAACKALVEPFSVTAGAIDSGDIMFLKKLPGIGDQRARLIVAKLQGKVGKYGLIKDNFSAGFSHKEDIIEDAIEILSQLQYKKHEASEMVEKAIKRNPSVKTSEDLLNEVYRERKTP